MRSRYRARRRARLVTPSTSVLRRAGSALTAWCSHRGITARRLSDEPFEVANEVGLIGVTELGGEVGPVAPRALRRVLCCFVKTVSLDDPLGTDPYVVTEETLERAFTRPREAHDIIDFRDLAVVRDGVHDVKDGIGVRVALGALGP